MTQTYQTLTKVDHSKDRYELIDEVLEQLQTDPSSQYKLNDGDNFCPICDNHTLRYGERVDNVATFFQATPDECDFCGYRQPKDKGEFEEMEQLAKCWELQVDFWGREFE